ncbi:MAG: STAS/SEC14 domain-containing protein [Alphaproteobacteria bacterium]|nr:STAS/SEC14 domain-containing protein [Alphaproteobacteria bacterium]
MYHILPESNGNTIGIRVEGQLSVDDYATLLPFVTEVIDHHGNIRILSDLRDFKGTNIRAMAKAICYLYKYASRVEKKVIIADEQWVYNWARLLGPLFKTEVRCYPSSKIERAWEWVSN